MRLISVSLLALAWALPAHAAQHWTYKDWQVFVEDHISEEDDYVFCSARTGGDGDPVLAVEVFSGDAGPPFHYPMAYVWESSPRSYPTLLQTGQTVDFIFDFDRSFHISAVANSWINDEGIAEASSGVGHLDQLPMLRAMQQGSFVEIWVGNDMLYEASLSGFTAAYGKMMDECGFDLHLPD